MRIITFFFILLSTSGFCQHAVFIHGGPSIQYNSHPGIVTDKHGNSIEGNFLYDRDEFPTFNLKETAANGKTTNKIKLESLERAVFYGSDKKWNTKDSTYFFRISNKKKLYRQLTYGSIKIYDDLFSVDENPGIFGHTFYIGTNGPTFYCSSKQSLITRLNSLGNNHQYNMTDDIKSIIRMAGRSE